MAQAMVFEYDQQDTLEAARALAARAADEEKERVEQEQADLFEQCLFDPLKAIDEPEPIVSLRAQTGTPQEHDTPVLTRGNVSAIVGQQKSRKSFFVTLLTAKVLDESNDTRVLVFDTEQALAHIARCARRVARLLECDGDQVPNGRLTYLNTRPLDPDARKTLLQYALERLHPDLVFIDGLADLVNDTNDLKEAKSMVQNIMRLSTMYNCAICSIIHLNPVDRWGDSKPRGHLGSELLRKCESVIELRRASVNDTTNVSPYQKSCTRDIPFDECAFVVDGRGLPQWCEVVKGKGNQSDPTNAIQDALRAIFDTPDKCLRYTELAQALADKRGRSVENEKKSIQKALKAGVLVKNEVGLYHLPIDQQPQQGALDLDPEFDDEQADDLPLAHYID